MKTSKHKTINWMIKGLLVTAAIISLCACGTERQGKADPDQTETVTTSADEETVSGASVTEDSSDEGSGINKSPEINWDINNSLSVNKPDDKYRTCYEVFVASFYDSDGDGMGDLNGLREKLDYIADLGFDAIWMMPIMPSPSYHKYDIKGYMDIDKDYGTLQDFDALVQAAHDKGIRIYLDLVINHTSSEHPWFKKASDYIKTLKKNEEPDIHSCPYLDYYNFTRDDSLSGYAELDGARSQWYYEAQFYEGMPDLNLSSAALRKEIIRIVDFWTDRGVDGFRLDTTTNFYTGSIKKNTEFLKWLSKIIYNAKKDAYIVGEAWTDLNTIAPMYKSGIDSFFDFSMGDKDGTIIKTVSGRTTDGASSYGKALTGLDDEIHKYIKEYINAPFLSNHDTGRVAGFLSGEESTPLIKMAWTMSMFEGGTSFLYYGEEIGMKGSGKDENKRVGFPWSDDPDSPGMCKAPENADKVEMIHGSLESQADDTGSIYNYIKQLIKIRNAYPSIARGKNIFHDEASDDKICIIEKKYKNEDILIMYNISDSIQAIDMSSVKTSGTEYETGGVLSTDGRMPEYTDGSCILPPYSVMVLKQKTDK
ncbi:MAG: alpha-amylase [Eubacterium sp.]|nr:alpha-amylase [Eubacterium sp.]